VDSDVEEEAELYDDFEFEDEEDETEPLKSMFSHLHLCAAHLFQLALKDMVKASPNVANEVRRAISGQGRQTAAATLPSAR